MNIAVTNCLIFGGKLDGSGNAEISYNEFLAWLAYRGARYNITLLREQADLILQEEIAIEMDGLVPIEKLMGQVYHWDPKIYQFDSGH